MTFVTKPRVHHPNLPINELGLTRRDYEGSSLRFARAVATTP
jgi:2-oxoglutarate ferredoxin oxidoreductase subunit beta